MNALRYLTREYGISDENGNNYFLDYFIRTQTERYAVEENGLNFHHPQIIGEEKYRKQLNKQNTCVLWGIKLFRFSKEDCAFQNRIEDDIKQYFGKDTTAFVDDGLKIDRKVELYEHQTISLQEIQKRRMAGIKALLIVLPTASGKSRIVEEDLREFAKEKPGFRGLILVHGNQYSCGLEGKSTGICTGTGRENRDQNLCLYVQTLYGISSRLLQLYRSG